MCKFQTLFLVISILISQKSLSFDFSPFSGTFLLLVTKSDNKVYVCSSAAISREQLVTAAHCLEDLKSIKVLKGSAISEGQEYFKVKSYSLHSRYRKDDSFFLYDIGKIKLEKKLPKDIKFYPLSRILEDRDELTRVGFGMRNGVNSRTVITSIKTYKVYYDYFEAEDYYSFSGDSGGPIFQARNGRYYIVGVHSTKEGDVSLNPHFDKKVIRWLRK